MRPATNTHPARSTLTLPPRRHASFALADQILATRDQSGTVEFDPQFDGWFLVLGLRFNPTGPFTTMQAVTP